MVLGLLCYGIFSACCKRGKSIDLLVHSLTILKSLLFLTGWICWHILVVCHHIAARYDIYSVLHSRGIFFKLFTLLHLCFFLLLFFFFHNFWHCSFTPPKSQFYDGIFYHNTTRLKIPELNWFYGRVWNFVQLNVKL